MSMNILIGWTLQISLKIIIFTVIQTKSDWKTETNEKCISESVVYDKKNVCIHLWMVNRDKRAKGISKVVVKKIKLQQYEDVLFNESFLPSQISTLRSHNHDFFS